MAYRITANYFAPKLVNIDSRDKEYKKTHCISYNKCNFKCRFCEFYFRNQNLYKDYSDDEFSEIIDGLLKKGKSFKFTGGESTINPKLYDHIKIVKEKGGRVFLDSNGSNPIIIKKLLKDNMIDVLGISLKGLTSYKSKFWSGCLNNKICWDNVLDTISEASKYKNVTVIVTTVFKNDDNYDDLLQFSNILSKYDNVYLKINNLMGDKHHSDDKMVKVDSFKLNEWLIKLIKEKPEWKNRIIYVDDFRGVGSYDNIKFY